MPRRYRSRIRRPARKYAWYDTVLNSILTSGNAIVQNLSLNIASEHRVGMVVERVILDYEYNLSLAGSGGLISYGVTMWPQEAALSGVYPDPDDVDPEAKWMFKRSFAIVATDSANDISQATYAKHDIKSKRRFQTRDYRLVLVHQASTLSDNVNVNGMIRVLTST